MNSINLLDSDLWKDFPIRSFYTVAEDGTLYPQSEHASGVYQPTSYVPRYILLRTNSSSKKIESALSASLAAERPGFAIYNLIGKESVLGAIIDVDRDQFTGSSCLPDGIFLSRGKREEGDLVTDVYEIKKDFRAFSLGPDDATANYWFVTNQRWYRQKYNPKSLGFSKKR